MSDSVFQKVRVTQYEVMEDVTDQAQKFAPVYRQDDDTLGEYAVTIRGWDGHRDLEKTYRVRAHDEDDAELEAKDEAAGDEDFDSGDRDDFEVVSLEIAGAKRFLVTLRALLPGLGGYSYTDFEVDADSEEDARNDPWVGDAEVVSVTEL